MRNYGDAPTVPCSSLRVPATHCSSLRSLALLASPQLPAFLRATPFSPPRHPQPVPIGTLCPFSASRPP
eukprot:15461568-Alexandrium_andersonii.AAC.1